MNYFQQYKASKVTLTDWSMWKRVRQLIEKRRKQIIESAIKLFAQNGFHLTSVQDIVDDCGISKGAFYNYFSAKEELHIAILKHYFEQMSMHFTQIKDTYSDPREKLKAFLKFQFEQTSEQRELFVVFLREQSFSINEELSHFIEQTKQKTFIEYEKLLIEIYGETIRPFIGDIILVGEGLSNAYIIAMLFHNLEMDVFVLPDFILNRIEDTIKAFQSGEKPIIRQHKGLNFFQPGVFTKISNKEQAISLLTEMLESLETLDLTEEQIIGLPKVITFLISELNKNDFDTYSFQGMLANLKEITKFDQQRKRIAQLMNVGLL